MKRPESTGQAVAGRRAKVTPPRVRFRSGVSVAEGIVGVLIVVLLLAIGSPFLLQARTAARLNACRSHLQTLTHALHAYHDVHAQLPPAAVWNVHATASLALHASKRIDVITHENWAQLLLPFAGQESLARQIDPHRPVGAAENARVRTAALSVMTCPDDTFHRADNRYRFSIEGSQETPIEFARGNYAFNGGTHDLQFDEPSTASPKGDFAHLVMQDEPRQYQLWGNGIGGINKSFAWEDFENGRSTLVALEEVRAGIHPLDPRGVWALGQIGGSITWAHGVNGDAFAPNHQWPRADDVLGCRSLHEAVGSETLLAERMPCVDYVDVNQQATARSLHPGGVHVAFLDGAVRFINDAIDPGLWHVIHSRETPATVLDKAFDQQLAETNVLQDAVPPSPRDDATGKSATDGQIPGQVWKNSVGMEFVGIPAGEFQMGIPDQGNSSTPPPECPVHLVRMTRPFQLGVCEVTRDQFLQVLSESNVVPSTERGLDGRLPISSVTWEDAHDFCQRLSELPEEQQAGRRYRLPTEAEWEYACRAGRSEPYHWRSQRSAGDASGEAAGILPALPITPVGSYPPNEFGVYDLRGNVWEWTADWFDRDYYARSLKDDPQGPARGYLKVVRGGDWRFVGEPCRIDYAMMPPWKANPVVGFRVVCEPRSADE